MTPQQPNQPPQLSPEDAQAVDQLFADGRIWNSPAQLADAREKCCAQLIQLVEAYPVETATQADSQVILKATLSQICDHSQASSFPSHLRFNPCETSTVDATTRMLRINWREAISAAALIIITISVTVPMLSNARAQATRQACCSNLQGAAVGFTGYANDYNGEMPSIYNDDEIPEGNWLTSRANSANLFSLAREGYVSLETLACPWNPYALTNSQLLAAENWPTRMSASYSYQNQFGQSQRLWANPVANTAVMSDRSPLIDACVKDNAAHSSSSAAAADNAQHQVDGSDNSTCHDGQYQSILLSDGRVVRNQKPYVGIADNIWLPRNIPTSPKDFFTYLGTETPVDELDSMLIQ